MQTEIVVLVDEQNNILGTTPKSTVHTNNTPLHRAFSLFLFNPQGELLLQQRSHFKKTWPLVWSNSCCGHPGLNESNIDAARRRVKDELGMDIDSIEEIAPYRYSFTKDGVMENEICPILVGTTSAVPDINPEEVETIRWISWSDFLNETRQDQADTYSPWCKEEVEILDQNNRFKQIIGL